MARDCAIQAKVAGDCFTILEDLLIALRLPGFAEALRDLESLIR